MKAMQLAGWRLAAMLAAFCAIFAVTVYYINERSVERLLIAQANAKSLDVAAHFARNVPNIGATLQGATPSADSTKYILSELKHTKVEELKLFSIEGKKVLSSKMLEDPNLQVNSEDALGAHAPDALSALKENKAFSKLELEDDGTLLTETYVPVLIDDKIVGAAEVYLDQTVSANEFRNMFVGSSLMISLLAALAFGLPALGFYWRTRQKIAADQNVHFMASHDSLTRLPNRTNFQASLSRGMNSSHDRGEAAMVHFVDIDFFKDVNDRNGHDFGDRVLQAIAGRLQSTLRNGDIVSRFGGDEFVIAQFNFSKNDEIGAASKRIAQAFKEPFKIDDREILITASIGTAVSPAHGATADEILKNADTAVYVVKSRGRNALCYFNAKFDEEKSKRLKLEAIVREAVAAQSFEVYFQPLMRFNREKTDTELKGFEALLRLKDRDGQPVSPSEFIPVAEDIGLIDEIGTWVLDQACSVAANWPDDVQISVNLSAAQFRRRSIVESTRSALQKSGVRAGRLLLEITESLLLVDTDSVLEQLKQLKELGVSIVMDDFGTGYSSLGYMMKFPFDQIKIDRSFINELSAESNQASSVVQTIITFGHTMNMRVTAEGVETEEQAATLRRMNCDDAQGYHYGRPMPAVDVASLLLKSGKAKLYQSPGDIVEADLPESNVA
jgi:diguanylate cyclase (GGDEF)-like protein